MNYRIHPVRIALIAILLCAFQPVSQIHAEGLAQTSENYSRIALNSLIPPASASSMLSDEGVYRLGESYFSPVLHIQSAIQKKVSVLTLEPIKSFKIGEQPVIIAHLTTATGAPIPNHLIQIYSYKNRRAAGITDSTGTAKITLHFNFYPGTYDIEAVFNGSLSDSLLPSHASVKLEMDPAPVEIQTVPTLAGIKFLFNNQIYVSDASGKVHFTVDHIGRYHLEVLPIVNAANPNVRIDFSRWNENIFVPYRDFNMPRENKLQAGFLISYPVSLKYYDSANQPVDSARISQVSFKTSETPFTFKDPSQGWLPANKLVRRRGETLDSQSADYSLQNVMIDGINVVNQGQLRFQLQSNNTWSIKLFLFSAHLSAADALFHFPLGSGILLEYPNGVQKELAFTSSSAAIDAASLPRGLYQASVKGAGGIEPRMPLALSRDQKFEVLVFSRLDMEILFGIPALIALIFFFFGRILPQLVNRGRPRAQV